MTVRTRYELVVLLRLAGKGEFGSITYFDELQAYEARTRFDREVMRAQAIAGAQYALRTDQSDEIVGTVERVSVQLLERKAGDGWAGSPKIVDEDVKNEKAGLSVIVDATKVLAPT